MQLPPSIDNDRQCKKLRLAPQVKGLQISQIETSKDKIDQPKFAQGETMFIPPLGSSVIICGKSGCGKSTLLTNLVTDGRFYGPSPEKPKGWFDKKFIFSPTAGGDDVQKALGIEKKYTFTELEEAPELLSVVLDTQQTKIDSATGAHKVQQVLLVFDDVIGNTKFMNTAAFTRCFYQVRHVNGTTFICSQHFKRVPRICRLQANFIFFFQGMQTEVDTIVEEFAPPMYTKKEFRAIVDEATRDKYSFLTINMKVPWKYRFRKNLDQFIILDRLTDYVDTEDQHSVPNVPPVMEKKTFISADGYKANERSEAEDNLRSTINYLKDFHGTAKQKNRKC